MVTSLYRFGTFFNLYAPFAVTEKKQSQQKDDTRHFFSNTP